MESRQGMLNTERLKDNAADHETGSPAQGSVPAGAAGRVPASERVPSSEIVTRITPAGKMTLAEVRAKLDGRTGKRFWKNLDELADTPEFQELMCEEFPRQAGAGEWANSVSRRGFMKVMGASFALAGLAGCTKQPDEPIYPYIKQPEDIILGLPTFFATAHPFPTGAIPVLVKSDAFRPTKLEGNPEHPVSKGKCDAMTQGSLLDLYDPDRSQHVRFRGENAEWPHFQQEFQSNVEKLPGGQGLYFLSETTTSPTFAAQWKQVQAKFPQAKLVQYEPVSGDAHRAMSKAAFGDYYDTQYRLADADVILTLDADFLGGIAFPGFLPMAAAYSERHRFEAGKPMNRMYSVETMASVTGFKAEHRLALPPSGIDAFVTALAGSLTGVEGTGASIAPSSLTPESSKFMLAVLKDLKKTDGRCAVVVGPQSSPACQAAAMQMNAALGAVGKAVFYTTPIHPIPSEGGADLKTMVAEMQAGRVQWLVMLGTNPLYNAPADLRFGDAFNNVPNTVHLGSHVDETGFYATWHIPKAHYLESWTDCRASDGTISIVQPMIAPLYGGVTPHDLLATLIDPSQGAYDVVFATAKTYIQGDFAMGWRKALHDGWVEGTAFEPVAGVGTPKAMPAVASAPAPVGKTLEIRFLPDPSLYDGRYGNNGWLQELPKQVTNLSWDNAALVSLKTMQEYGVEENQAIVLEVNGQTLMTPVLMVPGHADGAVTLHLGAGRRAEAGRVAAGVGVDAYHLRTVDQPYAAGGLKLTGTKQTYDLCVTKVHNIEHRGSYAQHDLEKKELDTEGTYSLAGHEAEERGIIRYATYDEATKDPDFAHKGAGETLVNKVGYNPEGESPKDEDSMWAGAWSYTQQDPSSREMQNAWAMSVDLNSCIGCNACVVACYAENNIAVVGREQVKIGRNMQWLRIDSYFEGDLGNPKAHFMPMMCQHCEQAGCEQVCPVGATVHTPEGLNTMVYNRCVGTRYCSNNCVYKVRRFNFLLYSDYETESLKFMRNPDVTVRSRGVMEKCTYCVQRIEEAKLTADKENRGIRDGEIVTACQQTCPTNAIIFGNKNDPKSKVAARRESERDYQALGDLNYRPRTTYTAGVINPNPELA